jgi:hypothetical protein
MSKAATFSDLILRAPTRPSPRAGGGLGWGRLEGCLQAPGPSPFETPRSRAAPQGEGVEFVRYLTQ